MEFTPRHTRKRPGVAAAHMQRIQWMNKVNMSQLCDTAAKKANAKLGFMNRVQIIKSNSSALFCTSQTPLGILHQILGTTFKEGH